MYTIKSLKQFQRQLISETSSLEKELQKYPKENLFVSRNGKYKKYYICNGRNPIYIKKKNRSFAEELAIKKYKQLSLAEKKQALELLNQLISHYETSASAASNLLDVSSPYYDLLKNYHSSRSPLSSEWAQQEFQHSSSHPEHLIHKTLSGHLVRSKSEVIISNALFQHHIPYRYECAIELDNLIIYPDFTILNPRDQSIVYWEHFGMMEQPAYRDSAFRKLRLYGDHNIIPSKNLITTYEMLTYPLDSAEIDEIIKKYFL